MSCLPYASLLDCIEQLSRTLSCGHPPLAVHGREVGADLPDRPIPLEELRDRLLDRTASDDLKNAAWSLLTRRAQTSGGDWVIGAAGVMMPGLRRIASRLTRGGHRYRHDIHSEVVVGFLEGLLKTRPAAPALSGVLWWAAYRRGLAARKAEHQGAGRQLTEADGLEACRIRPASGHPDLVLARAVGTGVLTAEDADLIGCTRMQRQPLAVAAQRLGIPYTDCYRRRLRAERRLADYLGRSRGSRPVRRKPLPDAA